MGMTQLQAQAMSQLFYRVLNLGAARRNQIQEATKKAAERPAGSTAHGTAPPPLPGPAPQSQALVPLPGGGDISAREPPVREEQAEAKRHKPSDEPMADQPAMVA